MGSVACFTTQNGRQSNHLASEVNIVSLYRPLDDPSETAEIQYSRV